MKWGADAMPEKRITQKFYSDDQRRCLLEKYKVPSNLTDSVISHLEGSAAIWKQKLGPDEIRANRKRARAKWKELARLSSKLADALEDLPEDVRTRFNMISDSDGFQAIVAKGDETAQGLRIYRFDNGNELLVMDPEDMFRGVRYIRDRANEEMANEPRLPKGKWFDYPLHLWMTNMEILWREILGRPFTRDVAPNGEPITPAAEFVIDAFGVLDPEMPSKTILNQMRKTIHSKRGRRQNQALAE